MTTSASGKDLDRVHSKGADPACSTASTTDVDFYDALETWQDGPPLCAARHRGVRSTPQSREPSDAFNFPCENILSAARSLLIIVEITRLLYGIDVAQIRGGSTPGS